jgi:hypothetical protein
VHKVHNGFGRDATLQAAVDQRLALKKGSQIGSEKKCVNMHNRHRLTILKAAAIYYPM